MKLLNLATAGIGAGLGAMYLGNEGKGETFTSYPFPSRGKRLLGFEQVATSEKALEKYNLNPPGRTPNADKIIQMAHDKLSKNGNIHPIDQLKIVDIHKFQTLNLYYNILELILILL